MAAGSAGQRNELGDILRWFHESERFARSVVEAASKGVQVFLAVGAEIAARLSESGPGEPDRSRHLAFGDVAAAFEMLGRLRVAEIVDQVVGSGRTDARASVMT